MRIDSGQYSAMRGDARLAYENWWLSVVLKRPWQSCEREDKCKKMITNIVVISSLDMISAASSRIDQFRRIHDLLCVKHV